jgi:hypothetical protein
VTAVAWLEGENQQLDLHFYCMGDAEANEEVDSLDNPEVKAHVRL